MNRAPMRSRRSQLSMLAKNRGFAVLVDDRATAPGREPDSALVLEVGAVADVGVGAEPPQPPTSAAAATRNVAALSLICPRSSFPLT